MSKLSPYIFDLHSIKNESQSNLKISWFFIKNIFATDLADDRKTIMTNSMVNRKLLIPNDHVVIYRPELFALRLDDVPLHDESGNTKYADSHLGPLLVGLVDIYISCKLPPSDVRMKWLINTLIEHRVLTNIFDPSNKTNTTFTELFDYEG